MRMGASSNLRPVDLQLPTFVGDISDLDVSLGRRVRPWHRDGVNRQLIDSFLSDPLVSRAAKNRRGFQVFFRGIIVQG